MHFLDRTLRLIKEQLAESLDDAIVLTALNETRVLIYADVSAARSYSAQTAIVTSAFLLARCGLDVWLDVPDFPLVGPQPPLVQTTIPSALTQFSRETNRQLRVSRGRPNRFDVLLVLGDSPANAGTASLQVRLNCTRWTGILGNNGPWPNIDEPFGAMASAAMATAETFKYAMQRLRAHALHTKLFDDQFRIRTEYSMSLAPEDMTLANTLGALDIVSAGAVTNAALFALVRIPGVSGHVRVIEPKDYDDTNHNRCMMMRGDSLGRSKALDIAQHSTSTLRITPIVETFQDALASGKLKRPANHIIVGVDDIPTRWNVQRVAPHWLSIGATTHWSAMSSFHLANGPCARCLHPRNDDTGVGPAPTISFVSFWAGLLCAAYLMRELARIDNAPEQVFLTPTGLSDTHGIWRSSIMAHHLCPVHGKAA